MMTMRKSDDRGRGQHGWLDSRHSFSFAGYRDPQHIGFRRLLVINEDRVAPGAGFGTHPHDTMEIISYVLEGALEHRDSTGVGSIVRPGEIQRMSAGTGIRHSEFNASKTEAVHFLQIWIQPDGRRLPPSYEQKPIPVGGPSVLIASPDGRDGSATIHGDVDLYRVTPAIGETVVLGLRPDRGAWLQVVRGSVAVNGLALSEGDGLAIEDEAELRIAGRGVHNEVLAFDID